MLRGGGGDVSLFAECGDMRRNGRKNFGGSLNER